MRLLIDTSQFSQVQRDIADTKRLTRRRIWAEVRRAAFGLERGVKLRMPVDTGRAKSAWAHETGPLGGGQAIWIENEDELSIAQGTTVDYVEFLNEGSSSQAPAGFIDAEAVRAGEELAARIAGAATRSA